MPKTRKCLGCDNLTDEPGALLCKRCVLPEAAPPPKKYKILLVDDDIGTTKELKKELEATLYFNVITSFDGNSGFKKISYEKPDLIILDVLMPLMNGQEFVEKLRGQKDHESRLIPILILADNIRMKKFFTKGEIQGYFVKPVNLKKLFTAMRDLLFDDEKKS